MAAKRRNLKKMVMEDLGRYDWVVADAESHRGPCTFDLFGVADLIGFNLWHVVLVQVTSKDHRADRRKKILAWKHLKLWKSNVSRWFLLATVDRDGNIEHEHL